MEEFFKILTKTVLFFSGSALGGVLGYLLKTQIDHRLAISRNYEVIRVSEFNKAAATFRAAFVDEIYTLRRSEKYGEKDPLNILTEPIFAGHEKAKIMFEPFLSNTDLSAFNIAWDNYRNYYRRYHENKVNVENANSFSPGDTDTIKEISKFCLDHIDSLFSFAEPKIST